MDKGLKGLTGEEVSGKKVIEGIERIHWEKTSSLCFVGATAACMHYLGEPVSNDYVMGISGGAFKLFWHPAWAPSNCDLLMYGEEPIRRTFNSLGYGYQYIMREGREKPDVDVTGTRAQFAPLIVASIDAGIPVIAQGIVGPPECSVVAGYERRGEVLYGRSYFQEDPEAYFRAENWSCFGVILIGAKQEKPSPRQVLMNTLEWAIKLTREPSFEGMPASAKYTRRHISGLAAYDAIAAALERDDEYPADNVEILAFRCTALSNDGLWLLTDKRRAAASFTNSMAEQGFTGAEELRQAAGEYEQETVLLHQAAEKTPGSWMPADEVRKIANPTLRRDLARWLREAKAYEARAVSHLERAFEQLKAAE